MAFVKRALGFTIQLGQGSFGNSGFETVEAPPGLWASARIDRNGSPAYNSADVQIAGMPIELMNQLSRVGLQAAAVRNNVITVRAGNADDGALSTVFRGVIAEAWTDFSNPTEAVFCVNADTGRLTAMKPAAPTSYTGSTDVATIMGTLAKQMGYVLENNGVSAQLSNPYLAGSARDQALAVAEAAGVYVYFEDDGGVMAICPKDAARGGFVPKISPLLDMEGYPAYVGPGTISLTTEYNPQLRFLGNVQVENSVVSGANGRWRVFDLKHDLSTRPGGPWFSRIKANNIAATSGVGA